MQEHLFESLPEFQSRESFPKGIIDLELTDLQKAVLKLLAFINHPRSITELKKLTGDIITSLPEYRMVKKSLVAACVDFFDEHGFFISQRGGISLHPVLLQKLLPLADTHLELIDIAYNYERDRGYQANASGKLKLAILSRDIDHVNREISGYGFYHYGSRVQRLMEALMDLGDLSRINPVLRDLDENFRYEFLEQPPFYLPYSYFEQWASVLLSQNTNLYPKAVFNYLSCAHLILPRQKVIDLTRELSANPGSLFFSELLRGNTEKALAMGASWLQSLQEEHGHRRKELPGAFGLLYAIVLIASGERDHLNLAGTFLRNTKKQLPKFSDEKNPFIQYAEILLIFINHRTGKIRSDPNFIRYEYQSPLHQQFMASVLSWMGNPLTGAIMPLNASEKEEMEYRAAGLVFKDEQVENNGQRLRELDKKLDAIPLAGLLKAEEPWEILLSALASGQERTKRKDPEKASRLLWIFDPLDEYSLGVIEQTKNTRGWSKGKQRSLRGLLNKIPDFATPGDIQIINSLYKDPYYHTISTKKQEELMEALSDHPHVYTVSLPRLPVEIRIQEARIQIHKKGEGASISLNPSLPDERVVMESRTRYIYTKWSQKALRVHRILQELGTDSITIPATGMKKASPVIDSLGETVPVTGDLATITAKTKKSANIPVLQLTPVNDQLHIQLLIEILKDEEPLLVPGIGSSEILVETSKGQKLNIRRDKEKEKEIKADLAGRIAWLQEMQTSTAEIFIDDDRDILDFLSEIKEKAPEVKVTWPEGERLRVAKVVSSFDISISIKRNRNWFELNGEVRIDEGLKLSIQQLLDRSQGGTLKYIQLSDIAFVAIHKDLLKRLALLNAAAHKKGETLGVHPLGASTVENLIRDIPELVTDINWKENIQKLEALKSYQPQLPGNLQARLRPYQEEGVLWLDRMHQGGVGCCLADDMGLGKTIQVISIMLRYSPDGPALVIAPSSVCANWEKEIIRFAPSLNPRVLNSQKREATLKELSGHDVLIASYGILQSNPDLLATREWNMVTLDEAHAVKNPKSVRSKAVMKLKARFRVLTTGTPIQNHLGELWNLFQFMNPGMLGSRDEFIKKHVDGNSNSRSTQNRSALNLYIAPFILRRNKSEVLDDLPEKTEITLNITLSEQEKAMYELLREKAIEQISHSDNSAGARHMQILSEISKLRLMSCNPLLVAPESKLPSSKMEALETLIEDLLNANHKALIFSQFTKHLALIREMLDQKGLSYQYLDGSTPVKKREEIIREFQNGESELFLISLKAGGSGLNLTAADYVIHMDPWWNPAVEDQASDRAHRIGQTRPVTIYRLIAENTIEEKIVKLHHEKRDLADKLLANTGLTAKISSEDLYNLIVNT